MRSVIEKYSKGMERMYDDKKYDAHFQTLWNGNELVKRERRFNVKASKQERLLVVSNSG